MQDDAHVYCTYDQIQDELLACLDFGYFLYDLFGLDMRVELSLRPDNKLGTDEDWDFAEEELRKALATRGLDYVESQGEGSFYGPKIDIHMNDSLGRSWQLGTVQLDLQMPKRFGLTYQGEDNAEHTPAMIHRALLGSLERFVGVYLEHTGGDLPVWLAPEQVRVHPGRGRLRGRRRGDRRGAARRGNPGRGGRAQRDPRPQNPRRRAGEGPLRRRVGRPGDPRRAGGPPPPRRAVDAEPGRAGRRDRGYW